jgi:D-alanine-D-alanine ligase
MKINVGVFFGGTSVEHEVSVISGLQAAHALDEEKYQPVPVYIAKNGDWYTGDALLEIENYKDLPSLFNKAVKVVLGKGQNGKAVLTKFPAGLFGAKTVNTLDVAFPVLHGTYGEDGVLQGLLEIHGLPYVGCDVLSSATGMDKIVMKMIVRDSGIPIADFVWFYANKWVDDSASLAAEIREKLQFPVIVKPANLGSSVGISKADDERELEEAVTLAMSFANKIVVEKMVANLKEVNCSVLGDYEEAEASVCETVLSSKEILTYQDKYMSGGSTKGMSGTSRIIPADISPEMTERVQALAKATFHALGCSGVSRIDFLIDQAAGDVYVNEINTIPGSLSFYLWEPSGKSFTQMTSDLISLAFKRQRERSSLTFSYDTNLLAMRGKGGSKGGAKGFGGVKR